MFKIMRHWSVLRSLVDHNAAQLGAEIQTFAHATGAEPSSTAGEEALVFCLWSVRVAILNAETSAIDRALALWMFDRSVRLRSRDSTANDAARGSGLYELYHRRAREVLSTIWNIFLVEGADHPELPLSPRTARLFARHAGLRSPGTTDEMLASLLRVLRDRSWACSAPLLSA